jgi:hypothetical protein
MQKGFYNRVMTSNRVLNSSKSQPVIKPAKINNGEKLQFVNDNVEKQVFHNEMKENVSLSATLLENRVNNLENIIQALLSKNIEIENKLNELQFVGTKKSNEVKDIESQNVEEEVKKEVQFELNDFESVKTEN